MIPVSRIPFSRKTLTAQGGVALTAALGIGLVLVGASGACADEERTLAGRVVDRSGAGVPEAKVWAVGGMRYEPRTLGETTTDGQGRFVLPKLPVPENYLRTPARPYPPEIGYDLLARARDGRLAWLDRYVVSQQYPADIQLDLLEVTDAQGHLVDHAGRPIAGAEVIPIHVSRQENPARGSISAVLPATVATLLHATTATDGSFVVKGFPRNTELGAQISAPGFGEPVVYWTLSAPTTITLDGRLGGIKGRVRTPDQSGLKGAPTLRLSLMLSSYGQKFRLDCSRRTQIGADGSFHFAAVPPGRYMITPELVADSAFLASSLNNVVVGPGAEVAGLEIRLEPTVTITGKVVDAETGKGIAGVGVHGMVVGSRTPFMSIPPVESDAEGRYHVRVGRGKVLITTNYTPGIYNEPAFGENASREISADGTWPDLKLPRAIVIEGVAVDCGGQPVPAAEVFAEAHRSRSNDRVRSSWNYPLPAIKTGRDGTFRLERLYPDDLLEVWAQVGEATTEGALAFRVKDHKGKLTITVDSKLTFRMRGTVADGAGKPIAEAQVLLYWRRNRPNGNSTSLWETHVTDASGQFSSGPLWPRDEYRLSVSAKGYTRFETPFVTGQPGMVRGLGTIKLVGTGGHVAGRVVGSEGKPIADVTVFNRGNSIGPVSVKTDLQGRFRLEGLIPGSKYAFARKDGFRFTGVRVEADTDLLTIRLLRSDEPPPAWTPGENPSAEEQRALARRILIRLWETYAKDKVAARNDRDVTACVLHMARIDPELAFDWSGQLGGMLDRDVRYAAAETAAEIDAEEALALINQKPDRFNQDEIQRLSEWFAEIDSTKALFFAEAAAVQARAIDEPERIRAKSRAGAMLMRLGRADSGRKLVEEAYEALSRLGVDDANAADRAVRTRAKIATACALAPFDLKRAQTLVDSIQEPNLRGRIPALLAFALAATDPAHAVAVADSLPSQSHDRYFIRMEVAYRSGAEHPDEALRIIEGMKELQAAKYQAEALGWLAVAVAKRDPKRAFALIDRALALPLDRERAFNRPDASGGATGTAARIAFCARRVGYPDMESVTARVLATRLTPDQYNSTMGPYRSNESTPALLALTDPAAAGEMLRQIAAAQGSLANPMARDTPDRWLIAWALADLKHAQTGVERELAAIEETKGSGLLRLAEVLAAPPTRRAEMLWGQKFETWYPGRNVPNY